MVKLHEKMPIRQEHFDITWEHMESSFLVFKLGSDLIKELRVAVYSTNKDIVNTA
jgi:hypothetical protein